MDYSKLSNQELLALKNGDYSKLSNETLLALKGSNNPVQEFSKDKELDIPTWQRAVVKNFSSNPETSLKYLSEKNPGMEFTVKNGEIYGKNKGETQFKPIDSDSFTWKDLLDIGTDVGQGVAEGAGAVAAGLATMNPLASYAAAGGIGAATEAAKQGVGSLLGLDNNMNAGNIALSGTASALMPAIGQKVIKPAYNSVKNTVAPGVASFLSGIDKDIIKNVNIDDAARNEMEKMGVTSFLDAREADIARALKKMKNEAGAKVDQFGGDSIDVSKISRDTIESLAATRDNLIPEHQAQVDALMNFLKAYDPKQSATEALMNQRPSLGIKPSELRAIRDTAGGYIGVPARDVPYSTQNAARNLVEGAQEAMENSAKDGDLFRGANQEYSSLMNQLRTNPNLRKFTPYASKSSDPTMNLANVLTAKYDKETFKAMPKLQAQKEAFDIIKKAGGPDMDTLARQYASHNIFQDPKKLPGNTLMENARGAAIGSAIGAGVGYLSGGGVAAGLPLTIGGGLIGEFLSSPYVIKTVAQANKKAEEKILKAASKTNPYVLKGTPKSIYNMMADESN